MRKMYSEPRGSQATWNVRDQHMTMTVMKIKELFENIYDYQDVRMVLWAHNSHLGDARAGHRGGEGFQLNETWNVGMYIVVCKLYWPYLGPIWGPDKV